MIRRLIPFLALVLGSIPVWGQGRQVSFRTLCLAHSGTITEVTLPAGKPDQGSTNITLFTSSVSDVVEGTFPGNEAVFYLKDGPSDKPVIAARGPLAKAKRQLLLFVPTAGEAGKPAYEIHAYDDELKDVPLGSVRAINLAPVPIRFLISGAATPQIPSNKHAVFPHSEKKDNYNMYPVKVEFLSGNGTWHSSYSNSWKATKRSRRVVITTVDAKSKQPTVQMFSDAPPWAEAGAAATP